MPQKTPTSTPEVPATDKIKDLSVALRIVHEETNYDELKKIGGAFATSYRVPTYELVYKSPGKLRVQGKAGPLSALLIYVGDTKRFRIGLIKKTQDVRGNPGQKQSLMDVGICSKDWLSTDYQAVFQRREGLLLVYKLVQRNTDNKSHELIWVNPKTFITEKRQSRNSEGELQKEIRYLKARELRPGIFLPSRVEIYNSQGKLGAVQTVEEVRVNVGVAESLFEL
jgi:outer membrane lipoprotein-sorting protein